MQQWRNRVIEQRMVPLGELAEHPGNWRRHPPRQRRVLEELLGSVGFAGAVIWNKRTGRLIDGHLRVEAARDSGEKALPAVVVDVDEDEERLLLASYDPLGAMAEPDGEAFKMLLDSLAGQGMDELLGELAGAMDISLLGDGSRAGEDEVPEPPKEPISQRGDLWLLGKHRLLCGDATSAEDVKRLLGGVTPLLMVTDPPYGVRYDPDWRNRADRANGKPYGARAVGQVQNDGRADWQEAWALFPGDVAYVWHAGRNASEVELSVTAVGFEIRCQIIWAKPRFVISRGDYHWQHEPCWYAVRQGKTGHWSGDRSQSTLWQITHQKSETGHGTQKPVECMRRPMINNSSPGQAVYDPFVGSGTSIIAAETVGRVCYAMEIDPIYVDVAVKRWETFTGETAKKVDDVERRSKKPKRAAAKADGAEGAAGQSGPKTAKRPRAKAGSGDSKLPA